MHYLCCLCIDFYDLYAWCDCWFVVYIWSVIYNLLNVCPFDYTAVAGSGKVGPKTGVNQTNQMDVVCCHLIERPQSVPQLSCNRTLQFSKTFRLNKNAIFSLSSIAVLQLQNPLNVFKCYIYTNLMSL